MRLIGPWHWESGHFIGCTDALELNKLKKVIKIQKDSSDNESNAIHQCNNEIESEEEVNKIESLSSEDLRYIAPGKTRARVISDFEAESGVDAIDTSFDKEISDEKAADGETLNEGRFYRLILYSKTCLC
ncbi:hypothetical protein TNIN_485971 [Trichonephila inaurata madagascariensis]|uniref:Uncharacterized protein n=1 Tax=Trichonephila inaurata madagascariensis TaxID=2747483 RepID=A0A8X7CQK8_9ARAC|nr:hypothetical protein TNIN_485971 [Trichonephila inaurata madagascariensis]